MEVVRDLTPWPAYNAAQNLFTNCAPLSTTTNSKILNGTIQLSRDVSAMCVDDVLDEGMVLVIIA